MAELNYMTFNFNMSTIKTWQMYRLVPKDHGKYNFEEETEKLPQTFIKLVHKIKALPISFVVAVILNKNMFTS